ncbi:hypothetical protein TNCT_260711 [Trichonephila clavata]|uniref:Uncharacterized protein n=1 Tax=Trichonephila clavata TaxID=2740835 RepID=A0A8X6GHP2_TRICU|nr:hypothetical protein TNCT_260711 [Trichonephila clavata]
MNSCSGPTGGRDEALKEKVGRRCELRNKSIGSCLLTAVEAKSRSMQSIYCTFYEENMRTFVITIQKFILNEQTLYLASTKLPPGNKQPHCSPKTSHLFATLTNPNPVYVIFYFHLFLFLSNLNKCPTMTPSQKKPTQSQTAND